MVLWCKVCGALIGVREPVSDWSVDRKAVCRFCGTAQVESPEEVTVPLDESSDAVPSGSTPQ